MILAVGGMLGWRGALVGTDLALVIFGGRWLRKAVLRSAGVIFTIGVILEFSADRHFRHFPLHELTRTME